MRLTKIGIAEYIVVFVGIVGLLASIRVTAETRQSVGAAQASHMMIDAGWTIGAGAGHSAARLREVMLADSRI